MRESPKYVIGQEYIPARKHKSTHTVIDIHKTYNSKGELVKYRYVSTHQFLGQTVTDYDVLETTIDRSMLV